MTELNGEMNLNLINTPDFFDWFLIQACGLNVTIVAFLIFPTQTNNFNVESLRGQAVAKQLRETVGEIQKDIGERLFDMSLR